MESKHTPTPWRWQDFGRGLILISEASGKPIVMDFIRQGMNGAQPRFGKRTDSMGGIMVPLSEWDTAPPDLEFIGKAANAHDALVEAVRFVKTFLNQLEDELPESDPLAQARRRYHAPLHAKLDAALALAEKE